MALRVRPFEGVRFNFARVSLGRSLCPPYDVIPQELDRRLRRIAGNAIHLELPARGSSAGYRRALRTWKRWLKRGVLVQDGRPAYYLVEQAFRFRGRGYRRAGVLAALGLDRGTARRVLRHERTLAKPKRDRTKVLRTLKVNTSPIFGIYGDSGGGIRRELAAAARFRPLATGRDAQGVAYRLWRVDEPRVVARLEKAFRGQKLLIADGHHRYEVAREYWKSAREKGADHILAYLVAQDDPGLIVNPTHRVLRSSARVLGALERTCEARPVSGLAALDRALERACSPYAFGVFNGGFRLMLPASGSGVRSRFGTDWLSRRLLTSVDAQDISYFHEAGAAVRDARSRRRLALIVRRFSVSDIRKAVERAGLLPQKSTYFFPKIATGLAFRSFASAAN